MAFGPQAPAAGKLECAGTATGEAWTQSPFPWLSEKHTAPRAFRKAQGVGVGTGLILSCPALSGHGRVTTASLSPAHQQPALHNVGGTLVNQSRHYFMHSFIQGMPKNPNSGPYSGRGVGDRRHTRHPPPISGCSRIGRTQEALSVKTGIMALAMGVPPAVVCSRWPSC